MELQIEQGTPQWLEWRKGKIGASDAATILGVSPWATPFQLWEEKLGLSKPKEMTASMQRGKDLERQALRAFEDIVGLIMFPKVMQHPLYEWMIASFDGVDFDMKIFVEIKCPGKSDHAIALDGHVPEKYIPQIQHQMEVLNVNSGYYFSYDGVKNACIEVHRKNDYIANLLRKEEEFWNCLQIFVPPALIDRDCIEISSEEWRVLSDEYKHCMKAIKEFELLAEKAKKRLIALADGKNARGAGIKLMKNFRKGNVDIDALAEIAGLDKELFRKPSSSFWRIL